MVKVIKRSYDIEVGYTIGATWGLFDQNVVKVLREPFIISIAWKDVNDSKVHVAALPDFNLYKKDKHNDKELVQFIAQKVFEGADILIAHNGNGYDKKWIYGRFAVHGITPPSPKLHVDTLLECRRLFKFNSNRLKDLGKYFNLGTKIDTGGIDLWYKCLEEHDMPSWDLMKKYNKQDVVLLEKVYHHILPFINNHPNIGKIISERSVCPNCGSKHLQSRGVRYGKRSWFCIDCRSWHTSTLKVGSQVI